MNQLIDAASPQVYWAEEQVRWTEVMTTRLNAIRESIPKEGPIETKDFTYHVYVCCSILLPVDAACELEMQHNDKDPLHSAFRLQVNMGINRWKEFKMGCTSFWQEVIRQVAVMEKCTGTVLDGFEAHLHKDHFSVHNGTGSVSKLPKGV